VAGEFHDAFRSLKAAPARDDGLGAQEIRFCHSRDGVRVAYATSGAGPAVVKTSHWMSHLEVDWTSPVLGHLIGELARGRRLVRYDQRGTGLSDRTPGSLSLDDFVADLEAVADDAGLERFALVGISQGCAISVSYAVRHPERVTKLVLLGGFAHGWRKTNVPGTLERMEAMGKLILHGWGKDNEAFRQVFTSLFIPRGTPEEARHFNDLQRMATTPETAARIFDAIGNFDIDSLLPQVKAPTLVVHNRDDDAVAFRAGRHLATRIPGARFLPLESKNHILLADEPAWPVLQSNLRAFLG
jgi:pimeloyl-ACP methyl ester carboxylesterase